MENTIVFVSIKGDWEHPSFFKTHVQPSAVEEERQKPRYFEVQDPSKMVLLRRAYSIPMIWRLEWELLNMPTW